MPTTEKGGITTLTVVVGLLEPPSVAPFSPPLCQPLVERRCKNWAGDGGMERGMKEKEKRCTQKSAAELEGVKVIVSDSGVCERRW